MALPADDYSVTEFRKFYCSLQSIKSNFEMYFPAVPKIRRACWHVLILTLRRPYWIWLALQRFLFSKPSSLPLSFVYSAPGDCKVSLDGREYIGNISNTMSGRRCQRWDRQSPHAHNQDVAEYFPDLLLADAADRCRNPSNPFIVRSSWCYTMDPYQRREYCDIPFCLGMCGARGTLCTDF